MKFKHAYILCILAILAGLAVLTAQGQQPQKPQTDQAPIQQAQPPTDVQLEQMRVDVAKRIRELSKQLNAIVGEQKRREVEQRKADKALRRNLKSTH